MIGRHPHCAPSGKWPVHVDGDVILDNGVLLLTVFSGHCALRLLTTLNYTMAFFTRLSTEQLWFIEQARVIELVFLAFFMSATVSAKGGIPAIGAEAFIQTAQVDIRTWHLLVIVPFLSIIVWIVPLYVVAYGLFHRLTEKMRVLQFIDDSSLGIGKKRLFRLRLDFGFH